MTAPQGNSSHPGQSAANNAAAAPQRFVAGAVDLGAVKQQARQREEHAQRAAEAGVSVDYVARAADVTPESFEQDLVLRSTQVPVIVLVGSERSEASVELKTLLTRLVEEPDVPQEQVTWVFRYIDADAVPQMAQALGVQGLPTVLALVAGRPAASFQGSQPEEQVETWLKSVEEAFEGKLQGLPADGASAEPAATDERLAQAEELVAAGQAGEAAALLAQLLADQNVEPGVRDAGRRLRVKAILGPKLADEHAAEAAIASAGEDPSRVEDAKVAADAWAFRGEKAQAFELLIAAMRATAGEDKDAAKEHLLELFDLYEAGDPEVIQARTNMANALF